MVRRAIIINVFVRLNRLESGYRQGVVKDWITWCLPVGRCVNCNSSRCASSASMSSNLIAPLNEQIIYLKTPTEGVFTSFV